MTGRWRSRLSWRMAVVVLGVAAFLMLVIVANIHLVKSAFESQPDCVAIGHEDEGGTAQYRAAKRSC